VVDLNFNTSAENFLGDSLYSNDKFRYDNFVNCAYFLFAEGKTGGRLIARLAQGARRFAAAYYKALFIESDLKLLVPCRLRIFKLDIKKTEEFINELETQLNMQKNIAKKLMNLFSEYRQRDTYCNMKKKLMLLKGFLEHQKMLEPVFDNIKNILLDEATPEDFEKIFEVVNDFYTKKIRTELLEMNIGF